jgi:hypothetical protein
MIHIVTIKDKIQLYKGEEPANAIEMVLLEEFGFTLVSQKDLYQVGDKAVFIEPDYNLPDNNPLFDSFVRPGGDPKKSKLGSHLRIRAVKFNLHTGDGMPVYSNGILLPSNEVFKYIPNRDYFDQLGVYKYEAPERNHGGNIKQGASREFPVGLYRTDEVNFNKVSWTFPMHLVGMVKADGSSCTIYSTNKVQGICSRNLEKPLKYFKKTGFKHGLWYKFLSYFGYDRGIYTEIESESEFVKVGKPYLEELVSHTLFGNKGIALRGELVGKGASNGSGNKNNPHSNVEPQILFFGADWYDGKTCERMDFISFMETLGYLGFKHPDIVFDKLFESREELLKTCESYFANNMIEGIVVRSLDGKWSSKILNLDYDSRK